MPTTLTNGIQLPDKGSVDWYNSMQSNYNLIDTHLGDTDTHVTAEDKANWNSKQGSLSQAQLDAIAQVATNTSDIATLQSGKANVSHTHSSSDITDIEDYATKQYVDNSISGLVDNAPAALDTLKELSTALNDDANFASTVTTALAAKANSADLATVATSGDYDDLSNKPSIPTNTSDLNNNSGFVTLNDFDIPSKTSDLTNDSGFITSSDVPTSTSDLINDSNFVDTSNSAVSSGITSAKVTDYDSHIADTDIHVTTADKTKWNNGVSQSYVLRYSSASVTDNSTIAYSTLDNTDNIKSGDKVIDVDGKIFSVVSVDTANQTVTVGSALIDLALDANVVHTSGNETVGGKKTFTDDMTVSKNASNMAIYLQNLSYDPKTNGQSGIEGKSCGINVLTSTGDPYINITAYGLSERTLLRLTNSYFTDSQNVDYDSVEFSIYGNGARSFRPRNTSNCDLGESNKKWKGVYATNYYYGSNNVEFSNKFCTLDTDQTVTSIKSFMGLRTEFKRSNNDGVLLFSNGAFSKGDTPLDVTQISRKYYGDATSVSSSIGYSSFSIQNNGNKTVYQLYSVANTAGSSSRTVFTLNYDKSLSGTDAQYATFGGNVLPDVTGTYNLGNSTTKWATINGLNPSSLSLPSDRSARIDISSYFTNTGTGDTNSYTVPANGYINLQLTDLVAVHCFSSTSNNLTNFCQTFSRASDGMIYVLFPVRKDDIFKTTWYTSTTVNVGGAYFIPCQGNV